MDKTAKTILAVAIGSLVLIGTGLVGYTYLVGNAQAAGTGMPCQTNPQCTSEQINAQNCTGMQNLSSTVCPTSGAQCSMMGNTTHMGTGMGMMHGGMMSHGACHGAV